jgi:hypothetical protein
MLSIRITNPSGVGLPISLPLPSGTTLPFGATINIGHAEAGYSRIEPKADVSGEAFGASVADNVGSVLTNSLGRAAYIHLDCMGTNGATESVTADSANAVNAMKVNHATSTVMSGPKGGGMVGRVTSTIESLSILGGLIQGTNVTASAQETLVNGKLTSSVGNSGFGNMTILGVPLPANPPPNTGRALPGLGKVIVNEQILGKNPGEGTIVNGLHISVSTPANALKLPVGTQLYFAHARVVAAPLAP